jgi:hypothetical protein
LGKKIDLNTLLSKLFFGQDKAITAVLSILCHAPGEREHDANSYLF